MISVFAATVFAALGGTNAAPVAQPDDGGFKFPITFDNGKIGVNFLGFHASAGLGGLITGNAADGGLQAEAGTPFGQRAYAGLGGGANGGRSRGGLYAGATAGGGVGARAGLGGAAGSDGNYGAAYAGASAGGVSANRVKILGQPPAPPAPLDVEIGQEYNAPVRASGGFQAGASFGAHSGLGGYANNYEEYYGPPIPREYYGPPFPREYYGPPPPHEYYYGPPPPPEYYGPPSTSTSAAEVYRNKPEPEEMTSLPPLKIEFAEEYTPPADNSNIQVISKKAKIRKPVKIAVAPAVAEEKDGVLQVYNLDVREQGFIPPPPPFPQYPLYVEKTKYKLRRRPHHHLRKQIYVTTGFAPQAVEVPVIGPGEGSFEGTGTVIVKNTINPARIINDAINVPVSTLNAVSKLVGGLAQGVEGSAVITKSVGVNADLPKPVVINAGGSALIGADTGYTKSVAVNAESSKPVSSSVNIEINKKFSSSF